MKKIFLLVVLTLVLKPLPTLAASGLVTCDGPDCTFCNLAQLVHNIINWVFLIIIPVGVLLFAFAGLRLVVSRGDPSALGDAKSQLTKIIIGLVIMFASWTIVDTVLKVATGSDYGVWNPISCGSQNPVFGGTSVTNPSQVQ